MFFKNKPLLFSSQEMDEMVANIKRAEKMSSGEIRVHLDRSHKGDPLERAKCMFHKLAMHQTEEHNGVLIYIAQKERKMAICGDTAIHEQVKEVFWEEVISEMQSDFSKGLYAQGVNKAILKTGEELKKYFPYENKHDKNELPDEISCA